MGGPRNHQELYNELLEDTRIKPYPKFDLWPVVEKAKRQVVGHCGIIDKEVDGGPTFKEQVQQ
jgi:hypothetical protein